MAALIVPERAAEAEALKALKHVGLIGEALGELEKLRAAVPAGGEEATRKQAERWEREEAKAVAKVTRVRAAAKKEGVRLPPGVELPATAAEAQALKAALTSHYMAHAESRRTLERHMAEADAVRAGANKALDDAVGAAYKTQALSAHPDKRRGAGSTHEDTLRFQRVRTAYETLKDADQRRAYVRALRPGLFALHLTTVLTMPPAPPDRHVRPREISVAAGGGGGSVRGCGVARVRPRRRRRRRRRAAPGRRRAEPLHVPHCGCRRRLGRHASVGVRGRGHL